MGCLIKTLILKNQAGAYVPAFSLGIKKTKGGFIMLRVLPGFIGITVFLTVFIGALIVHDTMKNILSLV